MANTTNLDLVKPAGTDKALVSVINANSDKIDAFAGTTNQALANKPDNATEMPMSESDATTVASAISMLTRNILILKKETTTSGGNATFTFSGDRYTALLMITDNQYAKIGIYAIAFKKNNTPRVNCLVGSETLPTVDANGSITISLSVWSSCVLITTSLVDFSVT